MVPTMKEGWIPNTSDNFPWIGGMIPPPKIIITKKPEPWYWYFPKPASDNEKMQGHIIEQKRPVLRKAKTAVVPVVVNPMIVAIAPRVPKKARVKTGRSLAI